MGELIALVVSFFVLISLLVTVVYQLMCLADLEFDYINPYDSSSRINKVVLPEFIAQGALCLFYLFTGHWLMSFLCFPYLLYNIRLYTESIVLVCFLLHEFQSSIYYIGQCLKSQVIMFRLPLIFGSPALAEYPIFYGISMLKGKLAEFLYTRKQHFVDVTEIFNMLNWEKKLRLIKLGYLIFLIFASIFWMIMTILTEDE